MSLSDAVSATVAAFRRRPGDLLPWYLLGAAIPAVVRVVPFLAAVVGYGYLRATGRWAAITQQIGELEADPPDPQADPEAFEAWAQGFEPILEQFLTPVTLALVAATILGSLLVGIALAAAVPAGQLTACSARLRNNRGVAAGFAGARRYWLSFLGLYVLELLAWIAVALAVGIAAALVGGLLAVTTGSTLPALVVGVAAAVVAIALFAAVRAVFAFAPVAVVVDDTTALESVSNAVAFVRSRPVAAGFYYALAIGTTVAISIASGALVYVNVISVVSLVSVLLALPALDLLKTALYNDYRGRLAPPAPVERSVRTQFRDGIRHGWAEMTTFVRRTPGTHALVVALALASFWAGWAVAEPLAGSVETSIAARLEGHVPPAAALEFFGNNWTVAMTTAVSGVVLLLPALASLLFNGVFMGFFARTEVDPVELLAFVAPHGVLEIPAILVASALGIRLSVLGWRTYRGRESRTALGDALERAFWVLVGVGILLAVAAFIEGFVSPYYYELFL
ncbi:stage II sporulation protein M [Haloterrigena alkaliphila]|uniref:Stage II sporulation protein M n=1 Tax=Haloterrigena alkaliphila TaxID=2816475 RepID=A0A8A2VDF5_9EURY|nr:stage II sporulation protein M [Haloterrigena alkaliphila]QSX00070.1 stage II sporulation protein M [Haloterrigena alkaliphila]